jgi:hypothetical protein
MVGLVLRFEMRCLVWDLAVSWRAEAWRRDEGDGWESQLDNQKNHALAEKATDTLSTVIPQGWPVLRCAGLSRRRRPLNGLEQDSATPVLTCTTCSGFSLELQPACVPGLVPIHSDGHLLDPSLGHLHTHTQ